MASYDVTVRGSAIATQAANLVVSIVEEVLQQYQQDVSETFESPQQQSALADKYIDVVQRILASWGWDIPETNVILNELRTRFINKLAAQGGKITAKELAMHITAAIEEYLKFACPRKISTILRSAIPSRATQYKVEQLGDVIFTISSPTAPLNTIRTPNATVELRDIRVVIEAIRPLSWNIGDEPTAFTREVNEIARALLEGKPIPTTQLPPPQGVVEVTISAMERENDDTSLGLQVTTSFATEITVQGVANAISEQLAPFVLNTFPRVWSLLSREQDNTQHLSVLERTAIYRWLDGFTKEHPQLRWVLSPTAVTHTVTKDYYSSELTRTPGTIAIHEHTFIAARTGATLFLIKFQYNILHNTVTCKVGIGEMGRFTQEFEHSAPLPPNFQITIEHLKEILDAISREHAHKIETNLGAAAIHILQYTNSDAQPYIERSLAEKPIIPLNYIGLVINKVRLEDIKPNFVHPNYSIEFTFIVPPDGYTEDYRSEWPRIERIVVTSTLTYLLGITEASISAQTTEHLVAEFEDGSVLDEPNLQTLGLRIEYSSFKRPVPEEHRPLVGLLNIMLNKAISAITLVFVDVALEKFFAGKTAAHPEATEAEEREPVEREQPLQFYKSIYPIRL